MWIDLTHPIHAEMPVWPDAQRPSLTQQCVIDETCPVRVSWISMSAHAGTHLDAPSHFLVDGKMVESLSLEDLIGPTWIGDTGDESIVDERVLESLSIPHDAIRIFLRTTNTSRNLMAQSEFDPTYVGLDLSGARWLIARGIRMIGFDYLSVQAFNASDATHRELLACGTILVEGLNLSQTLPGWHEAMVLPLLGKDLDGAPVRAVARRLPD